MPPTPPPPTALSSSATLYVASLYSTILSIFLGLFVTLAQATVFFLQLLLLWLGCCSSGDEHEDGVDFYYAEEDGRRRAYTVDMLDEYVVRVRPELLFPNASHDAEHRKVEPRDFTQCDESDEVVAPEDGEKEPLVVRFGTVPDYGSVGP